MTEFRDLIETYVDAQYYEGGGAVSVQSWLTEDIVKLIQLLDAELQRRYDEEVKIRRECHEAFQADLFNGDDDEQEEFDDRDYW